MQHSHAARWEVNLSCVRPLKATQAYTDFLLATAALQGVGETCAAMTPCMRLYAFLGQSLAADHPDGTHPYVEWIRTYADPSFEALAVRLENLLDRYAGDTSQVRSVYQRAMALELNFFEVHTPADGC